MFQFARPFLPTRRFPMHFTHLAPGASGVPHTVQVFPADDTRGHSLWRKFAGLACILIAGLCHADTPVDTRMDFRDLDREVQSIKEELLDLNQELYQLETLTRDAHPAQLVILVSVAEDSPGQLESVSLRIDGEPVTRHVYADGEAASLRHGGIHRLHTHDLGSAGRVLEISLTGRLENGREFRQQERVSLTGVTGRRYLELHLERRANGSRPTLRIREWTS